MNSWKALVFICLLIACKNSNTGDTRSSLDSTCIPVIETFFNKIETNNYTAAINDLLKSNENIDLMDSATIAMKERYGSINQISGKYRGYSLLKKRNINNDLAAYSYLVKYDKKFYRFIFVFYNNGINTKIYKFLFDDTAELEVEESLKLYM